MIGFTCGSPSYDYYVAKLVNLTMVYTKLLSLSTLIEITWKALRNNAWDTPGQVSFRMSILYARDHAVSITIQVHAKNVSKNASTRCI